MAVEVAVGGGAELCTSGDTNTRSEGPRSPSCLLQPRLWGALPPQCCTPGAPSPEVVEGPEVVPLSTNPATVFARLDKDIIFYFFFILSPRPSGLLAKGRANVFPVV